MKGTPGPSRLLASELVLKPLGWGPGMLLNIWQSEREASSRRSAFSAAAVDGAERQSLVAALHAVGFGGYAGCIAARTVKALAAEEFPSDALWLDRCSQLDPLATALQARNRPHKSLAKTKLSKKLVFLSL